ncbi:MAG: anaerobic carbon-monoxide dehydrogenase catalytic subunit [Eubacteriales bacterium]|nr:anaerobic carbon-monoxide dehydrogenase catalytic subunit [Eubacteriales bacterium]
MKNKVVAGCSLETLLDIFGKVNPEKPLRVLVDAIMDGMLKGVALSRPLKTATSSAALPLRLPMTCTAVLHARGCSQRGGEKLLAALEYRTWKLGIHKATAEKFGAPLCQNYYKIRRKEDIRNVGTASSEI